MKIENGLIEFLKKHFGSMEDVEVAKDDGKTVWVTVDFGDDEICKLVINRRRGDNGNYRIVSMS